MTQTTAAPYAALILPDAEGLCARPYLDAAAGVLAARDPLIGGAPLRNPRRGTVQGGRYGMRVQAEPTGAYGPTIRIELTGSRTDLSEDADGAAILSETVVESLKRSTADIVEWATPTVLIDRDDFIALRRYVSPRRGDQLVHRTPAQAIAQDPVSALRRTVLDRPSGLRWLVQAIASVVKGRRLRGAAQISTFALALVIMQSAAQASGLLP